MIRVRSTVRSLSWASCSSDPATPGGVRKPQPVFSSCRPSLTLTRVVGVAGADIFKQVGDMGGKRRAQSSGTQGETVASGEAPAAQGGASRKQQTPGLSVHGAAWSADAHSCGKEQSGSTVEMCFSMRYDPSALVGWKEKLETALRNAVAEFGGKDFRIEQMRVGPSDDTLQRVLPLLLERLAPEGAAHCFRVCKAWMGEMEARGFCSKTVQLCSALTEGGKFHGLGQNPDANAFVQRSWACSGSLHQWLQAASQEPATSFLSRGAVSTADMLGLLLVERVCGKSEGRYPGLYTLTGHTNRVASVAISLDGQHVVSGSYDKLVKIWNVETGAAVSILERAR